MKIVVVGGGSGGHITPTLAVAAELKAKVPSAEIEYVIGHGDKLADVVAKNLDISKVTKIFSGKFRRYHGAGLLQFLDIPTLLKNIRDFFYVCIGLLQAFIYLITDRPDIIFIKGGFVGVPIGLAAAVLRIPYITHDSDAIPGLANRIIGRWAAAHAVAMPKEGYNYPADKTFEVGIPLSDSYETITAAKQQICKQSFGLDNDSLVIMVTGGGLGATRLNSAMAKISKRLLERYPELVILHIAGRGKDEVLAEEYQQVLGDNTELTDRVSVEALVDDLYRYSGAADVVVARAGATTIAELAVQGKACVIVPNPELTGGHQLKNAEVLEQHQAVVQVSDSAVQKNPEVLMQPIDVLLDSPARRLELARNLHQTAMTDSAERLANLLLDTLSRKSVA